MKKQSKTMRLLFLLIALIPVLTLMNYLSASRETKDEVVSSNEVAASSAKDSSIKQAASMNAGVTRTIYAAMQTSQSSSVKPINLVYKTYDGEAMTQEEWEAKQEAIIQAKREEIELQRKIDESTAYVTSTESIYEGYFTKYMDLRNVKAVTIDEMNYLIDEIVAGRDSELTGCGEAYIKAAKETGLNPIFLLCLTAQEAGWEVSETHARKNNPYSICMLDDNVEMGYTLGDSFGEGIINGAKWINEHYYEEGQHTLYDFIYGNKCYSSSKDSWMNNIVSNMNKCYNLLKSYQQEEE